MVRVWEAARQMAEGSEGVAEEMAKRFNIDEPKYYRLNVQQGVQGFNTSEWERMDEVAAHTHAYLQKADTSSQLNGLVAKLSERTVLEREIARIVATHEPVSEQAIPSHTHLGARPCQTLADGLETQTPDLVHIITSMLLARRFRQSINPRGEYC
ncbi:hypothetical protein OPQ81_011838 [Rhizoctonia solani]|nr:hypothetical protein OPQ81_011838 [Rhizoctonia solani]